MKAAQINDYGGKDVIQVTEDAPKPTAGEGMVLVEVYAAGVNPFDWKVREGYMQQMVELKFPATLGGDLAGVVAEIGEGVTDLSIGDEVYGQANALSGEGSYAEFTPVKAASLGLKPKNLDFVQAAAVPLAAASAYQALVEHMHLQSGQKVLIHGGAGGIGTFAIQLAKHIGAHVSTTAAGDGFEYVRKLGADDIIDYKKQDFTSVLMDKGFDAVYDTIGGETYKKSFQVLKKGGILVSMTEQADEELARQYGITSISQATKVTTERLNKITELLESGALSVQVDTTFPLDQAGEALEHLREGTHLGKVVLTIKEG